MLANAAWIFAACSADASAIRFLEVHPDTVFVTDTIIRTDTILRVDTLEIKVIDTLFVTDTLIVTDTICGCK